MTLTASEMIAKMELAYQNLRMTILAGNTITREKRNEIILQCREITASAVKQNNKFLGYTSGLEERFEFLKNQILIALPALKHMQIVD